MDSLLSSQELLSWKIGVVHRCAIGGSLMFAVRRQRSARTMNKASFLISLCRPVAWPSSDNPHCSTHNHRHRHHRHHRHRRVE